MRFFQLLALICITLAALPAWALPRVGASLPAFSLKNADGMSSASASDGRPLLILYESRASRPQNYPLKTKLIQLGNESPVYRQRLRLIPIVNLQAYDFWPIHGIAADAVRSEGKRLRSTLYCDWNGDVARILGTRAERASVILVDADGIVRFAVEGPLSVADQAKLFALLESQLVSPDALP